MPIPQNIREIAANIDANVPQDDRIALADYLASVEINEELFARCVRKSVKALRSFDKKDLIWLTKWMPIIVRDLEDEAC